MDTHTGLEMRAKAPMQPRIQNGDPVASGPREPAARRVSNVADARWQLLEFFADPGFEPAARVKRLLQLGLRLFGLDQAIVCQVVDAEYRIHDSAGDEHALAVGQLLDADHTYGSAIVATDRPHLLHHVRHSEMRAHPAYGRRKLEAYVGTPVRVDGHRFGTLEFAGVEPTQPFVAEHAELLQLMATWLGHELLRARRTDALIAAKEGAEASTRAKSAMLATVSHELRTAMGGVLGTAQYLAQGDLGPQHSQDVDNIVSSGLAMSNLLDDLLDFSSIEAGRLHLQEKPFSIDDIIDECAESMAPRLGKKALALHVAADSVLGLYFLGDGRRVRQILLNLLSNAIKYTDRGDIHLHAIWRSAVNGTPGALILEVVDTGIGIAAADQPLLFQRFTRAADERARTRHGTGLGLAICRQLCELMNGRISVQSTVGVGSAFRVELPLPRVEAPRESGRRRTRTMPSVRLPRELVVVVAEDNTISQRITERMVRRLGCRVLSAGTGVEAVAHMRRAVESRSQVDAVLMDCQMPVMDGYAATRAIRQLAASIADTPIIALTAGILSEDIERSLAAGMNRVLHKPLELTTLFEALLAIATDGD